MKIYSYPQTHAQLTGGMKNGAKSNYLISAYYMRFQYVIMEEHKIWIHYIMGLLCNDQAFFKVLCCLSLPLVRWKNSHLTITT